MYSLDGKNVVVAGGNSGLGKSIARNFLDAGANVLICSRNPEVLSAAAEELGAMSQVCDIGDWQATKDLAKTACRLLGGIDVAVNSAGYEENYRLLDHPPGHAEQMVAVQFTGALYFMQHMAAAMEHGGSIINLSSLTASIVAEGYTAYAGAKAGVNHASRIAASELAEQGIRVNVVSPTVVRTPMVEELLKQPGFEGALLEETPLGQLPFPQDVADAVLWLASEQSRFVTGENIHVDAGGRLRRLPRTPDFIRHATAESKS